MFFSKADYPSISLFEFIFAINRFPKKIVTLLLTIFFLFGATAISQPSSLPDSSKNIADSTLAKTETYADVRGFEKNESKPVNIFRNVLHTLFWPPRALIDLTLTSAGFSAVLIDEKKVVKTFEDIFYIYDNKFGWFPLVNVVTGSPRGFGLSLFYRKKYLEIAAKGAYSNNEIWGIKGEIEHIFFARRYFWELNLSGRLERDNNFRFYGIGNDPKNDSRSHYLPDNSNIYGIYTQHRALIDFNIGVRTSGNWEFFFTGIYQKRTIDASSRTNNFNFNHVFAVENLPGANTKSQKWYNEFSFRYDNRQNLSAISPGSRVEGYTGFSTGFKNDNERLLRLGFDVTQFIPIYRRNRLIIPRLVFDMVEDVRGLEEIAFVEYPRHLTFRGVNKKYLLRSDRYMMVPSLEYQWPLTYHLDGHIFLDYLLVAKSPENFTFTDAPWAAGFGIDAHTRYSEIGRFYFAYGSEGVFLKFSFGISSLFKDRSDWK